jgi:hypothetical protein
MDLLKTGTKKLEIGYEVPMLWKEGEPNLPNNRQVAEHRHQLLRNRFDRDPVYQAGCRVAMEKNFAEGYAVRLPAEALSEDAYYLPVFAVKKKWSEKLRMVFDAAARYRGKKAKIRLRRLGIQGLDWRDKLDEEETRWWEQWLTGQEQLRHFEVDRCLFPHAEDIVRTELHTFGDASEEAFATVTYTRVVYRDGTIRVRLAKAATTLAPVKTISIPKLELNAAVLAVRQSQFVQESLRQKVDARYFWTDSSTVRNWIRATASDYQVYVSHRIGEIQSRSEPQEWRFVRGKLNPADLATRSKLEDETIAVGGQPAHICTHITYMGTYMGHIW